MGFVTKLDLRQGMSDISTPLSYTHVASYQIFNASHMAPFDVPHVTHDMILRFMGVDFASIVEGSAKIPSSVGTEVKPMYLAAETATSIPVPTGKTPQQDKAMWEGECVHGFKFETLTNPFILSLL